ncbi:7658_t:CDS:2 [Scutellospora calospora]|uniref:7658_t:CDS:1 n=1 Tax=Scutellospora calospora TaxID=85575 RepID=A0ACA9K1M6_9GLOM|nr:7658_t:CDS:2 [Scutellospora calospora]
MAEGSFNRFFKWLGRVLFGITLVLLIYLCPILEFTKILYFVMHSDVVTLNNPIIEYIYLALSIPLPVGLIWLGILNRHCSVDIIKNKIIEELCFVPLYMIVISIVYTHYTVGNIGDVSLFCPVPEKNSVDVHKACVISTLNFLAMWLYTILLVFSIFAYFCNCCPEERDFNFKSKILAGVRLDDNESLLPKS